MQQSFEELPWSGWRVQYTALRRRGWQPQAFTEYVIKIHGRCNLACDYCYIYEMADQSWRHKPKAMSRDTFTSSCHMIAEHAARHGLTAVDLILHGGEPLLVGATELDFFARTARQTLEPDLDLSLGVQTNGVLIDDEVLRVCERWNIRIGVSLDGDETGHDRHRISPRGIGSHASVLDGLNKLLTDEHRHLFSGLLCTIDVDNDPIRTYEALLTHRPPAVDLLLPHGNWTTPPPHRSTDPATTPYADWLITVFDRWYSAPEQETEIRLFAVIMNRLLGGHRAYEAIGITPIRLAVIETDGSLEQVDELKSAFDGATRIQAIDRDNPLDAAMWDPSIIARQIGIQALHPTCRACPIHTVCGGGHYVHRYRQGSGFRNPSVYCPDLTKLIHHIDARVSIDLSAAIRGVAR
ncbi:FxsB family cyclophane-forming radical SAM/SPASM peptide maturase [Nocardia heshunensis]